MSDAHLLAALDNTPDAVAIFHPVLDAAGRLEDVEPLYLNRTARDRWFGGATLASMAGRRLFASDPHLRLLVETCREVVETGRPYREVRRFDSPTGTFWADVSVTLTDEGLVHASRDVTDAQLAREALEESRAGFAHAQRIAGVGSWVLDLPTGRQTWSDELFRMLGVPVADEAPPMAELAGLFVSGSGEHLREELDRVGRDGGTCEVLVSFRRPDGQTGEAIARGEAVRGPDGSITTVHGTVADVTELRRSQAALEAQLRQAQRLDAIGRLAGGIAHDFNNLLAAISGYAELVDERLDDASPERAHMAQVLAATDRAAVLTRQLLRFSRREPLAPEFLDPDAVIEHLLPMLDRLVGVRVRITMSHGSEGAQVLADPGQLEQVVVNLVVNARDAMPDGGEIRITTSTMHVDEADRGPGLAGPDGRVLRITLSDTGSGMDEATLARIFDPFFTTKEVGDGTGMGLATVYGIVTTFEGRIDVRSGPGAGTTFTIDLPAHAPAIAGSSSVASTTTRRETADRPLTILVAEDEDTIRALVGRALRRAGYRVTTVPSGDAALPLILDPDSVVDALVTDIRMPGMQGTELARRARKARPGLPILIMSGYVEDAVVQLEGEYGIVVVDKPFQIKAFLRRLHETFDEAAAHARP
ncbi:MAG: ATP-binding protein [Chloroflexota bacterium]